MKSYLIFQSVEVSFQAIMFTLQGLNGGEISAVVVRGEEGVLLVNPADGLISISKHQEGDRDKK